MRWVILALGLPPPIAQKHVHVQGHDLYLDLWIEVLRLGFEYDGLSKYNTETREGREAFMLEKRRDDLLNSTGHLANHFLNEDVASLPAGRRALARCMGAAALQQYTPRPCLVTP